MILVSLLILPSLTGAGYSISLAACADVSCTAHESSAEVEMDMLSDTIFTYSHNLFLSPASVNMDILSDTMGDPDHDFYISAASVTPHSTQAGEEITVNYFHCYSGDWTTSRAGELPGPSLPFNQYYLWRGPLPGFISIDRWQ